MKQLVVAPLVLMLLLAGCSGNSFVSDGGGGGGGGDPDPDPSGVPDSVRGNLNSATFTPGDPTISVDLSSQDAGALEATYQRASQFDVPGYVAYAYQETTSNRFVVALVREVGSAKGIVAVDGGQFTDYFGGGLFARADAYSIPSAGIVNYSGSYAGLLNGGPTLPGPGGSLDPARSFRTEGRVLITADFTNMALSGGIDQRSIVDNGAALEDLGLATAPITADGTYEGEVQRLDPSTGEYTAVGDYAGVFAGTDASEIAMVLLFSPLPDEPNAREHGLVVLGDCVSAGGPACP